MKAIFAILMLATNVAHAQTGQVLQEGDYFYLGKRMGVVQIAHTWGVKEIFGNPIVMLTDGNSVSANQLRIGLKLKAVPFQHNGILAKDFLVSTTAPTDTAPNRSESIVTRVSLVTNRLVSPLAPNQTFALETASGPRGQTFVRPEALTAHDSFVDSDKIADKIRSEYSIVKVEVEPATIETMLDPKSPHFDEETAGDMIDQAQNRQGFADSELGQFGAEKTIDDSRGVGKLAGATKLHSLLNQANDVPPAAFIDVKQEIRDAAREAGARK